MDKENLILVGGGGHCRSCIDVIENENVLRIAGIVDAENRKHEKVLGYEIIANDNDLPELVKEYANFMITIGSTKDPSKRVERFEYIKQLGGNFPLIVSPLAHISKHASLGQGTVVMHHAVVNAAARIGKNCIVNTKALIEHDSKIGDHCHLSTGCIINGTCRLGDRVFIGSGTVMANDISIGDDVIIGAGSFVKKSIEQPGFYIGNPARKVAIESRDQEVIKL